MHPVFRVEVDSRLVLVERTVRVHGVQRNGMLLCDELGDLPPLTGSKPLQDEKQDKREGKLLEEAKM